MSSLADAFFGTICLKNKLLTPEQLEICLARQGEAQNGSSEQIPMGQICLDLGYLTEEQINDVLEAQQKSEVMLEDVLYGKIAVTNNLISNSQLTEALSTQRNEDYERRLGEILVDKGYLSEPNVRAILKAQERLQD